MSENLKTKYSPLFWTNLASTLRELLAYIALENRFIWILN
jgi:hypothetical protein